MQRRSIVGRLGLAAAVAIAVAGCSRHEPGQEPVRPVQLMQV